MPSGASRPFADLDNCPFSTFGKLIWEISRSVVKINFDYNQGAYLIFCHYNLPEKEPDVIIIIFISILFLGISNITHVRGNPGSESGGWTR